MKVGLALGSGAARGWAHIGIIKALEKLGIEIDVVAGCSIGAYVGAAYASGHLDELGEWASSLTEWQVLRLMGIGINKGGVATGQKVFDYLAEHLSAETFEQLNKPLAITTTDLYSGKEVSFKTGDIIPAVRASCGIPGLFPPYRYQDRWLVDGAVVNPVPVNLCRELGADFIIAVNLSADFRPDIPDRTLQEHELNQQKTDSFFAKSHNYIMQKLSTPDKIPAPPSILSVMSNSLEILQARVTRSRLAGDPPDIVIEPQLRDFGIMEFYRASELIEEGSKSVERLEKQIRYQLQLG